MILPANATTLDRLSERRQIQLSRDSRLTEVRIVENRSASCERDPRSASEFSYSHRTHRQRVPFPGEKGAQPCKLRSAIGAAGNFKNAGAGSERRALFSAKLILRWCVLKVVKRNDDRNLARLRSLEHPPKSAKRPKLDNYISSLRQKAQE